MDGNTTPKSEVNIVKSKDKRKIPMFVKIAVPAVLLVSGVATYWGISNNNLVKSYEGKVYPGAYVFDKDVSGLTQTELRSTLESMVNDINEKKINVTVGDQSFEKSYLNLDTTIPYDSFEKEILEYGKDKTFFEKLDLIKTDEKRTYEFKLQYNEEKINEFVNSIDETVKEQPVDATISISSGNINVTDGKVGKELNKAELVKNIEAAIQTIKSDDVVQVAGNFQDINPKITGEALRTVDTVVSSFTTNYPAGPSGYNLEIAARNINGSLLMPGEVFSTETAIGPTTIENGFVEANTYVNGQVVKGVGGGVCQLASTLYNTELRAGILPTERMNHMMTVAYVPLGLDATLADNLIDLKFQNPYDYPIVINAYAGGGAVTVEFWSNKDALEGMRYEPKSYVKGLYADTWLYGYDDNGELVYEKYIDNSTYQPFN